MGPAIAAAGASALADAKWWRPYRTVGRVNVFHVDLRPNAVREAEALARLSDDERDRGRRFLHPGPRRRFALCRAALRAVLSDRLDCGSGDLAFRESRRGKPSALLRGRPAPISFNVSHGGNHGLVAVAPSGRLGVDVEERVSRIDPDGPIVDVFGPEERAELSAARGDDKLRLFFRLWTMKEALIKALGTGFAMDPALFQAPPAMRRGAPTGVFRFPHLPYAAWRLDDLGSDDFAAALAHETS